MSQTSAEIAVTTDKTGTTEDEQKYYETPRMSKSEARYKVCVRAAKGENQEEILTVSVRTLAEAAKRKSDMLEDLNIIFLFSRPDMAG